MFYLSVEILTYIHLKQLILSEDLYEYEMEFVSCSASSVRLIPLSNLNDRNLFRLLSKQERKKLLIYYTNLSKPQLRYTN